MSNFPKRKSVRLKEYDYSQPGAYFVTICSRNAGNVFGEIVDTTVRLNGQGSAIADCIHSLPKRFPRVTVDSFIIMPNHIHCIILLGNESRPGREQGASEASLARIIAYLKYQSTKQINAIFNMPGKKIWQRNYYEHVVRNEADLRRVREYIENNPAKWAFDRYNPNRE